MYKPGDTVYFEFGVQDAGGAATDADSTPTALVRRNGTVDAAETVTVTGSGTTGGYKGSFTVPAGYAAGDTVIVSVQAIVDATTGTPVTVFRDVIDSARSGEVYARIGAAGAGLTAIGDTRLTSIINYVDTVESVLVAITGAISTLQTTADAIGDSNDTLSAQSDAIAGAIATLQASADTIAAQTDTLETSAASLSGKADALSGKADALSDKADALSGKADALDDKADTIIAATDTLETSAATLATAISEVDTAIGELDIASGGALTTNQAAQLATIYANVQGGAVTVTERVTSGNTILIYRGDRLIVPFTGLGDVRDGREIWLTMKTDPASETDEQAVVQIKRTGGLTRFLAATPDTPAHGSIEFDDEATGTGRFILHEQKTALLTAPKTTYDIQLLDPDTGPLTKVSGHALLSTSTDVTRAIS